MNRLRDACEGALPLLRWAMTQNPEAAVSFADGIAAIEKALDVNPPLGIRVAIDIDAGIVQDVSADSTGVEVLIIDRDRNAEDLVSYSLRRPSRTYDPDQTERSFEEWSELHEEVTV